MSQANWAVRVVVPLALVAVGIGVWMLSGPEVDDTRRSDVRADRWNRDDPRYEELRERVEAEAKPGMERMDPQRLKAASDGEARRPDWRSARADLAAKLAASGREQIQRSPGAGGASPGSLGPMLERRVERVVVGSMENARDAVDRLEDRIGLSAEDRDALDGMVERMGKRVDAVEADLSAGLIEPGEALIQLEEIQRQTFDEITDATGTAGDPDLEAAFRTDPRPKRPRVPPPPGDQSVDWLQEEPAEPLE